MNPKLEQRKFVVPEVIIGYESSLHVGKYLKQFGAHKAMIVTDKNVTEQIWFSKIIQTIKDSEIEYTLFDDVTGNPKDFEAMLGAELFLAENCDSIVAIGGGSPMDCAKCIGIVATNGGHIQITSVWTKSVYQGLRSFVFQPLQEPRQTSLNLP